MLVHDFNHNHTRHRHSNRQTDRQDTRLSHVGWDHDWVSSSFASHSFSSTHLILVVSWQMGFTKSFCFESFFQSRDESPRLFRLSVLSKTLPRLSVLQGRRGCYLVLRGTRYWHRNLCLLVGRLWLKAVNCYLFLRNIRLCSSVFFA